MTKLDELRKRYAWFEQSLQRALAAGKIGSENVRFFVDQRQPLLYDDEGKLVLDSDGEPQIDTDADPFYFGVAQAYSYVGDPPTHTVAGHMKLALQLLDDRDAIARVIDVVCMDLSADHARARAAHG
jgi:hypothetical protein